MSSELSMAQLKELYLPPTDRFVIVDVPDMQFAMIDGAGRPGSDEHTRAIKWLFLSIYPIKRVAKERMGKDFAEPPLEGLWWADDMRDLVSGNRDKFKWRMLIVTANWVTKEMLSDGIDSARKKLGAVPETLRLERLHEGNSVQIMHLGPPWEAQPTIQAMHDEFLPQHNLKAAGRHHEIYLNDPNRVAPEKLRTVFRQPVRPIA